MIAVLYQTDMILNLKFHEWNKSIFRPFNSLKNAAEILNKSFPIHVKDG